MCEDFVSSKYYESNKFDLIIVVVVMTYKSIVYGVIVVVMPYYKAIDYVYYGYRRSVCSSKTIATCSAMSRHPNPDETYLAWVQSDPANPRSE